MSELLDIFRKDPLSCSKQDITAIVQAYRDRRKQFLIGNLSAGNASPKVTPKQAEAAKTAKLSDLDL